ncbi:hypothetical protein PGB90_005348 [Kerria lacca]
MLTIAYGPLFIPALSNLVTRQTDWDSFREVLDSLINLKTSLHTESDLEEAVKYYTSSICDAAKTATPSSGTVEQVRLSISYPLEIRQMVDERRHARR